ncbi:spindle and kinetochore-associated protein 2 [Trifolium pratense]|uniref:spindle and kinetochore-associated protein 2 n=1 Tax=Trifolium pratense TaxID=57577 RepID=UPI0008433CF4|nr:spindle and kinetochore-associated protein 2 [Trifolium pratense]
MGNEYHEATDGLVKLFRKADHDLDIVHHRLQTEFQQLYPDNANPMKLVSRIKKVQEEISILKGQCHELLAAKQDLIDKAQTVLVENRNLVQRMQSSVGIPFTGEDDDAFTNFNQVIDEWTDQIRSKTGNETHDSDSGDLNKLLFSAIVQSN